MGIRPVLVGLSSATAIRRALVVWYRRNARPLPWRKKKSLYAIWVSEVMLQQTQVASVIPHYQRFLEAFPTVECLARAPLEQALEVWSGLGYYRRARLLHRAAQAVVGDFGGRFPRSYEAARSLPGVGDYTARAILSIGCNLPYSVFDGNVARVVARLTALKGGAHEPRFRRRVDQYLDVLLSRRRPGEFNQAVMELGQTICLPRSPRCPACPLRKWCRAFRQRRADSFPAARPRRATVRSYLASAVIRRGPRVAMIRGLDDGLLDDLWNFPAAFGRSPAQALARLRARLAYLTQDSVRLGPLLGELKHSITFRAIHGRAYSATVTKNPSAGSFRWFYTAQLNQAAVSSLARKILELI